MEYLWLAVIPLMMCVNRFRGYADQAWLPGRNMYYAAAATAPVSYLATQDWYLSGIIALTFFAWAVGPWGRWFDLHRRPDDFGREGVEMTLYEKAINAISFGSDHAALFWRHLTGVFFGLYAIHDYTGINGLTVLAPIFAFFVVAAYEIAWLAIGDRKNPIGLAEWMTGFIWGVMIIYLSSL